LGDLSRLHPNADEVAAVFTLSLQHLLDPRNRGSQNLGFRGNVPVFHGGPKPVWGLTAYILASFLDDVLSPALAEANVRL
jgi:hypothetical protein